MLSSGAMQPEDYSSFLVRLWREPAYSGQPSTCHGEIEHIQSGICWRFTSLELLLTFLQQAAIAPETITRHTPDEQVLLAGDNRQS
jgi:hypothetical protein